MSAHDKKVVIYPGVDLFDAARCVADYRKSDAADKTGVDSWRMYQSENRQTGEFIRHTCQIYSTKTQIVVKKA